ncbi:hypothetical protein IMG5_202760 [Ichthyophthirius multifiliis]|uniref:Histidine kinase domain-containing protein n=1 Tax=Ichthyophthirius multifiliis TaxID=5932 RepID=G0R674_ICHMU|nr:hypothetical protein IMG5_202760 [Ichthyophthirius multifiliis]EGR27038.1 hypothetical protein IMG5_202760 [Ichthyophthirius multifiliis]|eukprot:XP_004023922.1 hypothetical protein IMG5_202760 [Ichthyophthirius multifiliis]
MVQIDKGKLLFEFSDFDLSGILKECMSLIQFQAQLKQINLLLEINANIAYIRSDEKRIKQVVLNLLSNSIKFTHEGHIKLKIYLAEQKTICVEVSDTGIGFREHQKQYIIDALKNNNDNILVDDVFGLGFGLSISNILAKGLSGGNKSIELSSQQNKGSIFKFYIKNHTSDVICCEMVQRECLVHNQNHVIQQIIKIIMEEIQVMK